MLRAVLEQLHTQSQELLMRVAADMIAVVSVVANLVICYVFMS